MSYLDSVDFNDIIGKIISKIDKTDDEIIFHCTDGYYYKMFHDQDCCESVGVDDINGDLNDLIGTPITLAEETMSGENPDDVSAEFKEYQESFTWTFYNLATIKGYVTIRWYGSSNGYYSESVNFEKLKPKHHE
jgi:hypothetical protein